jgi:hypothetical protein
LLLPYSGTSFQNEAWPRERLGAIDSNPSLVMMRDQLLAFAGSRGTWVTTRRGRLQGLVGARQRGGRQAWEIDYLIDTSEGAAVTVDLLESALAETGRSGAEKLFLRLAAGSELLPVAVEAGFLGYREEILYAGLPLRPAHAGSASLRPLDPSDSYPLYRLYNNSTPETAKRFEAATFAEWHAAQERRWLKGGVQLVLEGEGQALAWIKASHLPQGVSLELLVSEPALDQTTSIIATAVDAVDGGGLPLFVLLPRTDAALARRLVDYGLAPRQDFVSLMHRTTRPVTMPKLSPAIAKNPVGV